MSKKIAGGADKIVIDIKVGEGALLKDREEAKRLGKLLIEIGGIGLTEDNYDKYSNSFSSGRKLPDGSKIVLIHGDNDTMVPPSNADVVANNIGNANLLYKWSVSEAPHAFIVAGMHKNEYSNLISNFADCVANNNCSVFNGAADAVLNSK